MKYSYSIFETKEAYRVEINSDNRDKAIEISLEALNEDLAWKEEGDHLNLIVYEDDQVIFTMFQKLRDFCQFFRGES